MYHNLIYLDLTKLDLLGVAINIHDLKWQLFADFLELQMPKCARLLQHYDITKSTNLVNWLELSSTPLAACFTRTYKTVCTAGIPAISVSQLAFKHLPPIIFRWFSSNFPMGTWWTWHGRWLGTVQLGWTLNVRELGWTGWLQAVMEQLQFDWDICKNLGKCRLTGCSTWAPKTRPSKDQNMVEVNLCTE